MGPKPQKPATSKKTDMKKKEKVIEDKTFGLKNKKGAKMQKFVQQVEKQVKFGNNVKASKIVDPAAAKAGKKKEEEDPMKDLFKPVIVQKAVDKNVDPKSVVCAFFKQGQCTKGDKCKFSHDLSVERRSEKKNLYVDERKDEEGDTMEDWDEAKLEEVVAKKHGKTKPTTDIICKFFLDAVENSKYGWFWDCPNGPTCHYRHALPAGFVLKKDKKRIKELEKEHAITLEELIEEERKKLDSAKCTKVQVMEKSNDY